MSEKTVADSMRRQGLVARRINRRDGLTRQDKTAPTFPDLLKRDFTATRPNARWVGDMTEIVTAAGKLYLATVIDLPAAVPLKQFCGGSTPRGLEQRALPVTDRVSLNSAWLGSGPTVAVLLHQTDGNGLCGFLFYADYLARRDVRVAMLDLCGYGQSACLDPAIASDTTAQVKAIADAARADGAQRIVLVGASMGGSVAVTAARAVHAEAVADLSGPATFPFTQP